jgi:hypothetical protein
VTKAYLKSLGTVSQFTMPLSGGIYLGKILWIIFIVVKSFMILDHLSEGSRDGLARAVEGGDGNAPEDDACTPIDTPHSDMTLSVIKSIKTYSTSFSAALSSFDIQTWVSELECERNSRTTMNNMGKRQ